MRKDIIVMAAGFFLIFLGFNTTIQYFTVSYAQAGLAVLSLNALALTFLFFFIGSFLAPTLISRIGLKTGLLIGAFGYAIFIYSVLTKTTTLVIVSAILQGLCAAILWISEGAYIIHTTDEKKRTLALGIVNSATFAGSFRRAHNRAIGNKQFAPEQKQSSGLLPGLSAARSDIRIHDGRGNGNKFGSIPDDRDGNPCRGYADFCQGVKTKLSYFSSA